jgi:hypothetical protein
MMHIVHMHVTYGSTVSDEELTAISRRCNYVFRAAWGIEHELIIF